MIPVGFWSLKVEPGKTFTQSIGKRSVLRITNASYDEEVQGSARSVIKMRYPEYQDEDEDFDEDDLEEEDEEDSEDDDDVSDLSESELKELEKKAAEQGSDSEDEEDSEDEDSDNEEVPFVERVIPIVSLKPDTHEQATVNVTVPPAVEIVEFFVTGENPVYLAGNFETPAELLAEDSDDDSEEGSDEDSEDDSEEDSEEGSEDDSEGESESEVSEEYISDDESEIPEHSDGEGEPAPVKRKIEAAPEAPLSKKQRKELEAEKKTPPKPESNKKQLRPGLWIEDVKPGSGRSVKPGDKIAVRYIGKLNDAKGKTFDQNLSGKPLTFTVGRKDVIEGWDLGVQGLALGGERRITIPPALGYGRRGAGNVIPPNSTLYFEVKLLNIK